MLKRLLAITLVAGLVLSIAAPTATAARWRFDLRAKGKETDGRARSVGKVRLDWNRNYRKQRAVVRARLNDICPKDGYGAYLEVRAYYTTPDDSDYAYSNDRAEDVRGCRAKAKRVVLRTGFVPVSRLYKVEVQLYEYDADSGDIAFGDQDMVEFDPDLWDN